LAVNTFRVVAFRAYHSVIPRFTCSRYGSHSASFTVMSETTMVDAGARGDVSAPSICGLISLKVHPLTRTANSSTRTGLIRMDSLHWIRR
jgi:hypothetical protein